VESNDQDVPLAGEAIPKAEEASPKDEKALSPLGYRMQRLWRGANLRKVPLPTIIVSVLVVAAAYLAGKLIYRLRDELLLFLVAGFIALLLNPVVNFVLKWTFVRRRAWAVIVVTLLALFLFIGLLVLFGYHLVGAITSLVDKLPSYLASARTGKGWIGHLLTRYHVQKWVQANTPKLIAYAQDLSKPALSIGEGAFSLLIELATIFILVLLLLLEGPKLSGGIRRVLGAEEGGELSTIVARINDAVTGYMLGNFLTSLIAGIVVFVPLFIMNVPYPLLWALWVALVDFLPMIGGALAGIPTVAFAFFTEGTAAGIVTLIVFMVYTQIENHVLNPVIMSRTVKISPLLVLISVLVGAEVGAWIGGIFGGFVAALLSIPAAGALQVIVAEVWRLSGPNPGTIAPEPARERRRRWHRLRGWLPGRPGGTANTVTVSENVTVTETRTVSETLTLSETVSAGQPVADGDAGQPVADGDAGRAVQGDADAAASSGMGTLPDRAGAPLPASHRE
jgi:predicted PurR-regulated permease PerM